MNLKENKIQNVRIMTRPSFSAFLHYVPGKESIYIFCWYKAHCRQIGQVWCIGLLVYEWIRYIVMLTLCCCVKPNSEIFYIWWKESFKPAPAEMNHTDSTLKRGLTLFTAESEPGPTKSRNLVTMMQRETLTDIYIDLSRNGIETFWFSTWRIIKEALFWVSLSQY